MGEWMEWLGLVCAWPLWPGLAPRGRPTVTSKPGSWGVAAGGESPLWTLQQGGHCKEGVPHERDHEHAAKA